MEKKNSLIQGKIAMGREDSQPIGSGELGVMTKKWTEAPTNINEGKKGLLHLHKPPSYAV